MFLIRKEQLDHFRAKGTKRYVDRLADWLHEDNAALCRERGLDTRDRVVDFSRRATELAQSWGFDRELDTTQLALILLWFGLDARERVDFVADALGDRQLLPIGRVRKILAQARAREIPGIATIDLTRPGAEFEES